MPGEDYYEGFRQLENGVGLMALFESELRSAVACEPELLSAPAPLALACGVAAEDFMRRMVALLREKCPGLALEVFPIPK